MLVDLFMIGIALGCLISGDIVGFMISGLVSDTSLLNVI